MSKSTLASASARTSKDSALGTTSSKQISSNQKKNWRHNNRRFKRNKTTWKSFLECERPLKILVKCENVKGSVLGAHVLKEQMIEVKSLDSDEDLEDGTCDLDY